MQNKSKEKERIFMLDCARKYLTPAWIKRLIDEISAVGYNVLQIHFAEEMGHRLESKKFPWLAGGDHSLCVFYVAHGMPENDGKYITQDEMRDIVRHAQMRGMDVVPSFDSPGHMNYAVKRYNERFGADISNYFHKDGKRVIVSGSSIGKEKSAISYSRGIDLANPEAVAFAKELYSEYGAFFRELGCTSFDMGGDELLGFGDSVDNSVPKWQNLEHWEKHAKAVTGNPSAVAYDAFVLYMNELAALLYSLGYESVRMWNDDAYRYADTGWREAVKLDTSIDIQYWTHITNDSKNTARFYIEKGHSVYNFAAPYTYYTLYPDKAPTSKTPEQIEREWSPYVFDAVNPDNVVEAPSEKVKGAGMCLWTDTPDAMTEDELLENMRAHFTAIAKAAMKK
jgi:hexosaminidase